jgi:hydrogenase maturation protease
MVLGVGSPYRSDDRAGFEVVDRLSSRCAGENISLRKTSDPVTVLLSMSEGPDTLIVVDALHSQPKEGVVQLENPDLGELSETAFFSTHQLGIEDGIGLGDTLDMLPEFILLYGIPGTDFSHGTCLSSTTEAFVDETVKELFTQLNMKQGVT